MSKFKLSMVSAVVMTAMMCGSQASAMNTVGGGSGDGVSFGYATTFSEKNSVALGAGARGTGNQSVAIAQNANSTGDLSVALGQASRSGANNSTALGTSAKAEVDGGVALGSGSLSNRLGGTGFSFSTTGTGAEWVSTLGDVNVGQRQLTGLVAGSQDGDAVNVAQLKSLQQSSVFGSGASNVITPAVPDNPDTTDVDETQDAVTATNAAILGNNGKVLVNNGAAFGYNAQVMADAPELSVAIGANSVASTVGRTATSPYLAGGATVETSNGGAWASTGLVSFGYTETTDEGTVTRNRTLTGVAAGSEDNDAVNVAQLKQLENNTATQLSDLMTGKQQVSEIQLLARDEEGNPIVNAEGKSETIGLRYQVAAAAPAALADGDSGTATQSQGRLIYNNLDATGKVIGTETVATLNDGITISAGSSSSAAREGEAAPVKVDLNKGISFLTDGEYLSANVASDNNGGAVVTFSTTQALKDALANAGGNTGGNTGGDSGSNGNTGGSGWTPSQAQLAAMNGNFANGITVAPGEGNQAIQIKQGNVDMGGNRIQNVGNPINDGDAANKAYVDSTSRSLRNKINDVDKDLRAGVAMAMAVGGLPQAYMPGKSIVGVSAGTYHGQGGFALGLSHATDNRQWVFKGAASVDTRGNFGGQLSAGYQF